MVGRSFCIPGNLLYLLSGASQLLCFEYMWEEFGDTTPEEIAAIFTELLDEPMSNPIGALVFYMTSNPPNDCILPCDGLWRDATGYEALLNTPGLAILRTTDIDGNTTFQMPDMTDSFILSSGSRSLWANGGEETHQLTTGEMPAHTHDYTPPIPNIDLEAPGAPDILAAGVGGFEATLSEGGNQAHNNMPPYIVANIGMWVK